MVLPAVAVPQQQAYVVDNVGLAQLDLDACSPVLLDGVPGEAVVQVIVLRVSVQQRRLQLALHHLGTVLHGGNVLLRDWWGKGGVKGHRLGHFWDQLVVYSKALERGERGSITPSSQRIPSVTITICSKNATQLMLFTFTNHSLSILK